MMHYGWAGWGSGFWMLGGLLVMIGVVVLVAWIISTGRHVDRSSTRDPSRPTPNEILRERFARGEITEQEFEQAKKVLGPDR
jgi:putative membrane protein